MNEFVESCNKRPDREQRKEAREKQYIASAASNIHKIRALTVTWLRKERDILTHSQLHVLSSSEEILY